jgi:hypothetical protein
MSQSSSSNPSSTPSDVVRKTTFDHPPSRAELAEIVDKEFVDLPDPAPITRTVGNYTYALELGQQPDRARMCGFGDKVRPLDAVTEQC